MRKRRFLDPRFVMVERRRATILTCLMLWSVISFLLVSRFVMTTAEVVGDSMLPTLHNGARYVLDRWAFHFRDPERGEIVALRLPGYDDLSVKRIIAFPYERVQVRDRRIYINDRALDEPYLRPGVVTGPGQLSASTYLVDPDCYFVLGDNRPNSLDSRFFGAVRREWIVGRIVHQDRRSDAAL